MGSAYIKREDMSKGMHTWNSLGGIFEFYPPRALLFHGHWIQYTAGGTSKLVALSYLEHCREPYFAHSSLFLHAKLLVRGELSASQSREWEPAVDTFPISFFLPAASNGS